MTYPAESSRLHPPWDQWERGRQPKRGHFYMCNLNVSLEWMNVHKQNYYSTNNSYRKTMVVNNELVPFFPSSCWFQTPPYDPTSKTKRCGASKWKYATPKLFVAFKAQSSHCFFKLRGPWWLRIKFQSFRLVFPLFSQCPMVFHGFSPHLASHIHQRRVFPGIEDEGLLGVVVIHLGAAERRLRYITRV